MPGPGAGCSRLVGISQQSLSELKQEPGARTPGFSPSPMLPCVRSGTKPAAPRFRIQLYPGRCCLLGAEACDKGKAQPDPVLCSHRSQRAPELPPETCPVQGRAPSTHLQPPELAGQVQGGFLCFVDEAGVGLVLQQHLRLQGATWYRSSASSHTMGFTPCVMEFAPEGVWGAGLSLTTS